VNEMNTETSSVVTAAARINRAARIMDELFEDMTHNEGKPFDDQAAIIALRFVECDVNLALAQRLTQVIREDSIYPPPIQETMNYDEA
jgi:hypothetical protein